MAEAVDGELKRAVRVFDGEAGRAQGERRPHLPAGDLHAAHGDFLHGAGLGELGIAGHPPGRVPLQLQILDLLAQGGGEVGRLEGNHRLIVGRQLVARAGHRLEIGIIGAPDHPRRLGGAEADGVIGGHNRLPVVVQPLACHRVHRLAYLFIIGIIIFAPPLLEPLGGVPLREPGGDVGKVRPLQIGAGIGPLGSALAAVIGVSGHRLGLHGFDVIGGIQLVGHRADEKIPLAQLHHLPAVRIQHPEGVGGRGRGGVGGGGALSRAGGQGRLVPLQDAQGRQGQQQKHDEHHEHQRTIPFHKSTPFFSRAIPGEGIGGTCKNFMRTFHFHAHYFVLF